MDDRNHKNNNRCEALLKKHKSILRAQIQSQLEKLESEWRTQSSVNIFKRVIRLSEFIKARSVLSYVSMGCEVETHDLIRYCLKMNKTIYVPVFNRERKSYSIALIEDFDRDLRPGYFGVLEPHYCKPAIKNPDLAIVPGLAFDSKGNRLGRGKHYFDTLLRDFSGIKIALTFNFQLMRTIPVNDQDVPMDIVLTEEHIHYRVQ